MRGLGSGQQLAIGSLVGGTAFLANPFRHGPWGRLRPIGLRSAVQWVLDCHHDDFQGNPVLDAGGVEKGVRAPDVEALEWIAEP